MDNIIDSKGGIKKSELIKTALKDAPFLTEAQIKNQLELFAKRIKGEHGWLFLNSRDINYNMVFQVFEDASYKQIADYILCFLKESSFVDSGDKQDYGLLDSVKFVKMLKIKEFIDEGETSVGMYIGDSSVYFKLSLENWIVEDIKGENK